MNKKFLLRIIIALIIICSFNLILRTTKKGTVNVDIPEVSSSVEIAEILKKNGLIVNRTYFLGRLLFSEYRGKLRYGTFEFPKNAFIGTILKTLATDGARRSTVTVTIPEGFSAEMIKARICEAGICSEQDFENALKQSYDYAFLACIPDSDEINYRLPGFLYPSTYEFYSDSDAETVINTMLGEFEKNLKELNIPEDKLFETVTKASLIEREVSVDSERATVAGVIENRIAANMLLQIDATVVYAVTSGMYDINRVMYKDLEIDSRYNTYKYKGLPVGPICSPSINSINAALNPEKHSYLYYHTDNEKHDGSHIFTETYEEHTSTIK